MMYLGTPGRMVGLKCPVVQRDTADDGYRFVTTLEGRRKAQVAPGQRRVWDISVGRLATPSEVGALQEFSSGAWGRGPFWFIPEGAGLVNVMPSDQVLDAGPFPGGPMRLEDGSWAPLSRAARPSDGIIFWRDAGAPSDPPVLPGQTVTASAWVEGVGGYVMLQFCDHDEVVIASSQSVPNDTITTGKRLNVTATAPANAVYARISVRGATRATRPAITWTDQVTEWGEGQGCPKAVVTGPSRDLVRAVPGAPVLAELSFTVTEVG